jgi:hypothetical protein
VDRKKIGWWIGKKMLLQFRKNVHSQNGEDGVLEEIFKRIDPSLSNRDKWCVEFGAWDGKHLSNTFNLVKQGWNAVYIEGDKDKYLDLLETVKKFPNIEPINAMVGFKESDDNNLNKLLSDSTIPDNFDLLSIDIDSYDLAVWQCFVGKPKVVVIEINSSIKPGILQWHDGISQQGNSFSSTICVAKNKGYSLVCHTGNLIFVRDDLLELIELEDKMLLYPETLFLNDWVSGLNSMSLSNLIARKLPSSLKRLIKRVIK